MRSCQILALAGLTGLVLGMTGCGSSSTKTPITKSSSVPTLEAALPNLAVFGLTSCSYTSYKHTSRSIVPSPSDTLVEVVGHVAISQSGAAKLKADFKWEAVRRDQIPAALLAIVPAGQTLLSRKLNRSFDQNATYPNGFLVVIAGKYHELYFMARDLDHPIE